MTLYSMILRLGPHLRIPLHHHPTLHRRLLSNKMSLLSPPLVPRKADSTRNSGLSFHDHLHHHRHPKSTWRGVSRLPRLRASSTTRLAPQDGGLGEQRGSLADLILRKSKSCCRPACLEKVRRCRPDDLSKTHQPTHCTLTVGWTPVKFHVLHDYRNLGLTARDLRRSLTSQGVPSAPRGVRFAG